MPSSEFRISVVTIICVNLDQVLADVIICQHSERFAMHFEFIVFQVDVFEIEAVDLLTVTKVIVGHDGKEAKEGWYLDKVVVSVVDELHQTANSWTFKSHRY